MNQVRLVARTMYPIGQPSVDLWVSESYPDAEAAIKAFLASQQHRWMRYSHNMMFEHLIDDAPLYRGYVTQAHYEAASAKN